MLAQAASTRGSDLIYEWADALRVAAHDAYARLAVHNELEWQYYCFCQWTLLTLMEFDRFLLETDLSTSPYTMRYLENYSRFRAWATLLEAEQQELEKTIPNNELREMVLAAITGRGEQLAREWRDAVVLVARSFLGLAHV